MMSYDTFHEHARIVNCMYTMLADTPLDLERIQYHLPGPTRYSRARPCRVHWRYKDRYTVQLFPKGTIQLLGNTPLAECYSVRRFLIDLLSITLSPPKLCSCTVECTLDPHSLRLVALPSNQFVSNEREIFPGTLIQHPVRKRNFHSCFFTNGKVIVTGVKSLQEAYRELKRCIDQYQICK